MRSTKQLFQIKHRWGRSRTGILNLPHGQVQTPVFMPVGTQASVKSLLSCDLEAMGAEIILGNTYHLYLRPGDKAVRDWGGLHQVMHWDKPILTDSGGYQVSSLGHFRDLSSASTTKAKRSNPHLKPPKIDSDGVTFYSHLDGSQHRFTPEKAIDIQHNLGADIIMAFDEATPDKGYRYAQEAMRRTHTWLDRSIRRWQENQSKQEVEQLLFGIIQGGDYPDLRLESARYISNSDTPGIALGGGSVGADWRQTSQNAQWVRAGIDQLKPFYFMGVGVNPVDLIAAILDGADMFDCVAPTRIARNGLLYNGKLVSGDQLNQYDPSTWQYKIDFPEQPEIKYLSKFPKARISLAQARYQDDQEVIDPDCRCYTCSQGYTRAYLRHLMVARELSFYRLASIHNLTYMIETVAQMRRLIMDHD